MVKHSYFIGGRFSVSVLEVEGAMELFGTP